MPSRESERPSEIWREMLPDDPSATVEDMRAAYAEMAATHCVPEADVTTTDVTIDRLAALWVRTPAVSEDRTVLYLHGGGYALGSPHEYRDLTSRIGRAAGARVLVPDYRLAPEHPFPAAVEDALTSYRWLLAGGASPDRIVIAGDSAGGGLALAVLVALRDRGEPLPAAGICQSPLVDMEGTGASMDTRAEIDPLLNRQAVRQMAAAYLAGTDPRNPLAAPLHADFVGLPPLLIQVGEREVLLDDALRVADRARAAGVDVTLQRFEGMPHVFQMFASFLLEARDAIQGLGRFVRDRMADHQIVTSPVVT